METQSLSLTKWVYMAVHEAIFVFTMHVSKIQEGSESNIYISYFPDLVNIWS